MQSVTGPRSRPSTPTRDLSPTSLVPDEAVAQPSSSNNVENELARSVSVDNGKYQRRSPPPARRAKSQHDFNLDLIKNYPQLTGPSCGGAGFTKLRDILPLTGLLYKGSLRGP